MRGYGWRLAAKHSKDIGLRDTRFFFEFTLI